MQRTETTTIDGHTYGITQLPAMRASKLSVRLAGIIGPALARATSLAGKRLGDVDLGAAGDAVSALTDKLTPEEFESITKELLFSLTRDGKPCAPVAGGSFDVELGGEVLTVFKLLRFAVEVNYGDFFAVGRGLLSKMQAPAPGPSSSTASTT